MTTNNVAVRPLECRDQLDEAEAYFNHPLRVQNRELKEEVLTLKKLLRENGISWPSSWNIEKATAQPKARKTRSSGSPKSFILSSSDTPVRPVLPVEVQLQIMEYALTGKDPIIDPLCNLKSDRVTPHEKLPRNQITIGFLATCKAFLVEGTRMLWEKNDFIFSTPAALREFSNVPFEHRSKIDRITLRIVGQYYDDEKRVHTIRHYPLASKPGRRRSMKLRVNQRPEEESTLARKGFRSYTWSQVSDFLSALRPPFDPEYDVNAGLPRPRLFPALKSMRIDLVNFPAAFLKTPEIEFHQLAFHDLGCTLDELMVTGLPDCYAGSRALQDLCGMIKDDGLLLKSHDTFVMSSASLRTIIDGNVVAKAIRTWKPMAIEWNEMLGEDMDEDASFGQHDHHDHHYHHNVADLPSMPPAPPEEGHPESLWKQRRTIWKRVPVSRDSKQRKWMEFDRILGEKMGEYRQARDVDDIMDLICDRCGLVHDPLGWEDDDEF